MEEDNPKRAFSYVLLMTFFFTVLFVLDSVLGVTYEPNEHRLNQPKVETLPGEHTQAPVEHKAAPEEADEQEAAEEDSTETIQHGEVHGKS